MIPIVVFSQEDISGQLGKDLGRFFTISTIGENSILFDEKSEILIINADKQTCCDASNGILILGDTKHKEKCKSCCSVIIVDSSDMSLPDIDNRMPTQCITCGMSSKDTISFSSLDENEASISLMREIRDIQGNVVEPFEMTVRSKSSIDRYSPFYLLCIVALVIVLGKTATGFEILVD